MSCTLKNSMSQNSRLLRLVMGTGRAVFTNDLERKATNENK